MLSDNKIRQMIEEDRLEIDDANLDEQLNRSSVDLTVGPSYKRLATEDVFSAEEENGQIILEPDTFYHLHTLETLRLPDDIRGTTQPIINQALSGIIVVTGLVDPNYNGRLQLGVRNISETARILEVGDEIVQIEFDRVEE